MATVSIITHATVALCRAVELADFDPESLDEPVPDLRSKAVADHQPYFRRCLEFALGRLVEIACNLTNVLGNLNIRGKLSSLNNYEYSAYVFPTVTP